MSDPTEGAKKIRRRRRNPYAGLIHLLNQRYHQEWERAEALRSELASLKRWPVGPVLDWLRRLKHRLKPKSSTQGLLLLEQAIPYVAPGAGRQPAGRVSIVIPFKDRKELLANCLKSLRSSSYDHYEIILVDHGSESARTHRYLFRLAANPRIRVIHASGEFNFARLCNLGAAQAGGDYLLFLNNDTEVLCRDWLEQLLFIARDPRVGVVGGTLLYPDRTIQHAGLFPRSDGLWVHPYQGQPENHPGRGGELRLSRVVPAVTAACLLIGAELFRELGGFDEAYPVAYNDVDLCRRAQARGLLTVITPHARLLHYEGLSRGYTVDKPERVAG